MLAMNRPFALTFAHKPLLVSSSRHSLSTSTFRSRELHFNRTDFQSQGFESTYEPGKPTPGPLGQASKHGAPRLTPSLLKEHLDKYVVGQDKAKKVTAVAIFNHYQRIRELARQEEEEQSKREQQARCELRERERHSHPVENEYPGHIETVDLNAPPRTSSSASVSSSSTSPELEIGTRPLPDDSRTIIEKSNLLLLGPSGVGKTYILSTLARVLEVPFATVDCSALTQAGYIGTDIESSIERLLLASSHSIQKCESGIIFFDEVDKLAKPAVMTHGRDVSGEGVQQGLLKMIEGTTVTVNAKSDRSSKSESRASSDRERSSRDNQQASGKSEQYTIDTTNILFVFAGAFVGLEKIIASRLNTGSSLGFGAQLKASSPLTITKPSSSPPSPQPKPKTTKKLPNILDSVTPTDLQTYGLIPELLGRIPITVSLSPLTLQNLISILTEPRNSLVKQFIALFSTYGIQLTFTTGALHAIAERALAPPGNGRGGGGGRDGGIGGGGIGARGLRSILESVLQEVMFWGPGSGIRFVLVDEGFVRRQGGLSMPTSTSSTSSSSSSNTTTDNNAATETDDDEEYTHMPRVWSRGQNRAFEEAFEEEEERWRVAHGASSNSTAKEKDKERDWSFEKLRRVGSSGM